MARFPLLAFFFSFLDVFLFQISLPIVFPTLGLAKMYFYTYVCTYIFEADMLMEIRQRHALTDSCTFNKLTFELLGEHVFRPLWLMPT